ncbi:MAG: YfhO family protein, partial [Anaerolineales bacterium]|nr:YfhO family protein [Anaerolineales bacterium]
WRAGALAGAALAVLFLADPRWAFYAAVLAAGYWLAVLPPFARPRPPGRDLAAAAGLAALFLSLSAILLLPLFVFVTRSNRAALSLADAAVFSMPPLYLLGLLIPDLGGFHEWMTYLGVAPLLLALLAAIVRRQWFWGLAALAAGGFALGANSVVFPLLFRVLPGLGYLRVPPRAWFVVALAVAILGAQGLQYLIVDAWPRLRSSPALPRLRRFLPAAPVALAAILGLTLLDLWRVDVTLWEARPRPARVPAADWIAAHGAGERFRVYSPSYSLPLDDGLEHVDGVNPLQLAGSARVIAAAAGVPLAGYSVTLPRLDGPDLATANAAAVPDAAALGVLNVKYVAAEFPLEAPALRLAETFGRTRVYENLAFRPRVWREPEGPAALVEWSPNRLVVQAEGPGRLVVSEVAYPGWEAWVDGRPTPLDTAESILRAVPLEAGPHRVVLEFRPPSGLWGAAITLAGLAVLAGSLRWAR